MTKYTAFKRCIIEAWPNSTVYFCASMVMLDFGMPLDDGDHIAQHDFVKSLNMPSVLTPTALYLARHYPKTSKALFDERSKDEALAIFLRERAMESRQKRKLSTRESLDRRNYARDARRTRFIRARSLSKEHDWSTVK